MISWTRICIPIKVISWIRISLQMTSKNVWEMSLFKHLSKVLSLYRIQIRIKVEGRIGFRIKVTRRVGIRIRILIKEKGRIRIRIKVTMGVVILKLQAGFGSASK